MEPTKSDMASSVTNQEALVLRILESTTTKATKKIIPGGKKMLEDTDQKTLNRGVNTWLRIHRHFEWIKISFAEDPSKMDLTVKKVKSFPEGSHAIWELPKFGRKWLADQISDILATQKLIYIEAKKDGLYVATEREESDFGPDSESWLPNVEMMPIRRGQYKVR